MAGREQRHTRGFTLLELVVVLVIMGLVASMTVMRVDSISPRFETNREAGEIARLMRNARGEAITSGKVVRGELNPRSHQAAFFYEDAADDPNAFSPDAAPYLTQDWSDRVNLEKTMVGADTLLDNTQTVIVRFWPTGLCTPVRLYFQHAEKDFKVTLKINPLTGVTKLAPGFEQPADSEIHVDLPGRQPGAK